MGKLLEENEVSPALCVPSKSTDRLNMEPGPSYLRYCERENADSCSFPLSERSGLLGISAYFQAQKKRPEEWPSNRRSFG